MKAAVEAQIKRESEGGLSPDAALSKVAAALLSAERRELVLLLADESLAPRADMDPRAAMSLSSTMPEAA
jgi:hypothetical protein